ncbi:gastrokine-1-like [Lissotriton helveticus]
MKTLVLAAALLGVFLTQSLANDDINISNKGNVGGDTHQTVNIDNHDNVANINNYNGWNSWNSVWDYNRGLFAARLFHKRACVVSRMNKAVVPSLAQLGTVSHEKKPAAGAPHPRELTYTVTQNKIKNVAQFGKHVEALCKGVPTYYAQEIQGTSLFVDSSGCTGIGILNILGITLCGRITGC